MAAIETEYRVTITEHDGRPWCAGTYTGRIAAWRRVRLAVRSLVSLDWPVFISVHEIRETGEVLVYRGDLRDIGQAGQVRE